MNKESKYGGAMKKPLTGKKINSSSLLLLSVSSFVAGLVFLLVIIFPFYSYAKMKLPAEVNIKLKQPVKPGEPITFTITASSKIPFQSGTIIFILPPIESIPMQQIELWSGSADNPFENTVEYTVPPLNIGKYQFQASFNFTPQKDITKTMRVGDNLYLDVRSDDILSSNISFTQIKREELKKELDKRGLLNKSKGMLKSLAPDLLKRMEELNRQESEEQHLNHDDSNSEKLQKSLLEGVKEEAPVSNKNQKPMQVEKPIINEIQKAPLEGVKEETPVSNEYQKPMQVEKPVIDKIQKAPIEGIKDEVTQ